MLALILTAVLASGGFFAYQWWASAQVQAPVEPWFAAYVDVTATPTFEFESPATDSARDVMLSFIVASATDGCEPTWGTAYTLDEAAEKLDLDRRLARLEQQGGGIAVSFGGLNNDELSTSCDDRAKLAEAYRSVIDRYNVSTIDLDIEGDDLSDAEAGERRAEVLAEVQAGERAAGDDLAIWLTLPAATYGLTEEGATAVEQFLEAGVDLAGVNAMTMNFGQSLASDENSAEASIRALTETHRQLDFIYSNAGIELTPGTLWTKLGATPMIGQNDLVNEVFTLDDARALNTFGQAQGLGRMSMWSLNRDTTCGPNYADVTRVSDACSGVSQGDLRFSDLLAQGFEGRAVHAADHVTTPEPLDAADLVDDPKSSPYPIWAETSSYLEGTKVVWHRNVYLAKWWTKGDLPDNPVLNSWETPWTLIGPVLPGEKPIKMPSLPSGTYPDWAGTAIYDKGDRVLFDDVPYEAKWWNQGESPEAYSSNPDSSPWAPLTVDEIREVEESLDD
ncbi:chitinase [Homoserinimonas sp. A447]